MTTYAARKDYFKAWEQSPKRKAYRKAFEHSPKRKAYCEAYAELHKPARNERMRRYYWDDPVYRAKQSCRGRLNYAVRTGKAIKGRCEICGHEQVHAHHDDYSKPLEVRWLCRQHHLELHYP